MIKISLITPIKDQPQELKELIHSLIETTINLWEVELILVVDDDDPTTQRHVHVLSLLKGLSIRYFIVPKSDHFVRDYYNFAALKALGRWVMAINADSVFMTRGWDRIVCSRLEAEAAHFGDDILLGIVHDGLPRQGDPVIDHTRAIFPEKVEFSCWPILSKEYVDLMGGMMDERNWCWGADHWLGRLFVNLREGGRMVYMRGVKVDHKSHHTKIEVPQKASFQRFCEIMGKHPMIYTEQMAIEMASKVEQYLCQRHR